MPLYMDIHTVESDTFSVEDVVKAHMEDLAIQERFGVTQLKYWVNVEAKTLFCLMQGPDKEACNQVHKESHGNTACNIIEVSDDEFNLYLGSGKTFNDLAQTPSGEIDPGYRTLLLINLFCFTTNPDPLILPLQDIIKKHQGMLIPQPDNNFMASFFLSSNAILCALAIQEFLKTIWERVEFTMAISSGRPVDEKGDTFFGETKQNVQNICAAGLINTIYLDGKSKTLSKKENFSAELKRGDFTVVLPGDYKFLNRLLDLLEEHLNNPDFRSHHLYNLLGTSKSKASGIISSITGMAPNQLLQEIRLRKSISKLKARSETVAEIAYGLGFNSPTYFTRSFKKRYGILPSAFGQKKKI